MSKVTRPRGIARVAFEFLSQTPAPLPLALRAALAIVSVTQIFPDAGCMGAGAGDGVIFFDRSNEIKSGSGVRCNVTPI